MGLPARSMTGFARLSREFAEGTLTLSVRAVNHRALDLHLHLPQILDPFETAIRRAVSAAVARGHVDVRASFGVKSESVVRFNKPLLEAYIGAFRQAAHEYELPGQPDLNAALALPGMLTDETAAELGPEFEAKVLELLQEVLAIFNAEREREGSATVGAMRRHAAAIQTAVDEIAELRTGVVGALQAKLTERLGDLLAGANVEPARLAQEVAYLADRSDIAEEVTRLGIHQSRLGDLLEAGREIGKKLDFLLQEMNREATTILSKSGAAGETGRRLSELGLQVKSEIEKIREQSLNLE